MNAEEIKTELAGVDLAVIAQEHAHLVRENAFLRELVSQLRAEVREWTCLKCSAALSGEWKVFHYGCGGLVVPRMTAIAEKLRVALAWYADALNWASTPLLRTSSSADVLQIPEGPGWKRAGGARWHPPPLRRYKTFGALLR